ncbi:MAG: hypothetical protein E5W91_29470 [Mesorhizobium sp.]|uniref:hypothetical protein n=1 Tax=Mesorhizobium sp. TaxID=1871066 RepID=UPI00122B74DE|nr:hypothetical protein [Mesorhizobium sp.]TIS53786.1 MAG: hypothetical protein E5W91_29470 [Mesorhizobium sp.]
MRELNRPSSTTLAKTIEACIDNGDRLLNESYNLEFVSPSSSRYYLIAITQEEFAKAFMLYLVYSDVIPFSKLILRAMSDHSCKQLVGMLMDYMIMHWDKLEEHQEILDRELELGDDHFPLEIASALDILRYEKIGRWEKHVVYVGGVEPHPVAQKKWRKDSGTNENRTRYMFVSMATGALGAHHT